MNNTTDIFDKAKIEVQKLWTNHKELSNFVNFPKNLVLKSLKSQKISVTDKLFNWNKNLNTKLLELHKAFSDLSPYVNWEQWYKEKEVGKDFLNKYGSLKFIVLNNSLKSLTVIPLIFLDFMNNSPQISNFSLLLTSSI